MFPESYDRDINDGALPNPRLCACSSDIAFASGVFGNSPGCGGKNG